MNIEIQVKQKHIDEGKKFNCSFCPIALAIVDVGYSGPIVGARSIVFIDKDGKTRVFRNCTEGIKFVRDFDNDDPVEPFTLVLSKEIIKRK